VVLRAQGGAGVHLGLHLDVVGQQAGAGRAPLDERLHLGQQRVVVGVGRDVEVDQRADAEEEVHVQVVRQLRQVAEVSQVLFGVGRAPQGAVQGIELGRIDVRGQAAPGQELDQVLALAPRPGHAVETFHHAVTLVAGRRQLRGRHAVRRQAHAPVAAGQAGLQHAQVRGGRPTYAQAPGLPTFQVQRGGRVGPGQHGPDGGAAPIEQVHRRVRRRRPFEPHGQGLQGSGRTERGRQVDLEPAGGPSRNPPAGVQPAVADRGDSVPRLSGPRHSGRHVDAARREACEGQDVDRLGQGRGRVGGGVFRQLADVAKTGIVGGIGVRVTARDQPGAEQEPEHQGVP